MLNIKGSVLKTEIKSENVVENDTEQTVQGYFHSLKLENVKHEALDSTKEEQIDDVQSEKSKSKLFECKTCEKYFQSFKTLKVHEKIHSVKKSF